MQRFRGSLALVAACIAGYVAGSWNGGVVHAAPDSSKDLMAADREFDSSAAANGVEGWVSHFAPAGILMPEGSAMVVGQDAIREYITKTFTQGLSVRWEPIDAVVAGDLGYSYGVSKTVRTGADGQPAVSWGKYVTVWSKQRDRTWKVAATIGNSSPPPPAANAELK
jgi:ketosteroid isomerase-like protein